MMIANVLQGNALGLPLALRTADTTLIADADTSMNACSFYSTLRKEAAPCKMKL